MGMVMIVIKLMKEEDDGELGDGGDGENHANNNDDSAIPTASSLPTASFYPDDCIIIPQGLQRKPARLQIRMDHRWLVQRRLVAAKE